MQLIRFILKKKNWNNNQYLSRNIVSEGKKKAQDPRAPTKLDVSDDKQRQEKILFSILQCHIWYFTKYSGNILHEEHPKDLKQAMLYKRWSNKTNLTTDTPAWLTESFYVITNKWLELY